MLTIISNNQPRDIIYGWQLSEEERAEFDWIDSSDTLTWEDVEFFRYKGWMYCLSDIMGIDQNAPAEFQNWDGYVSETFFSGILVRYPREDWGDIGEGIIVGTYYS